jgi:serine protease
MVQTPLIPRCRPIFILVLAIFLAPLKVQAAVDRGAQGLWYLATDSQWAAPASIRSSLLGPGAGTVVVAVIDSGVLQDHPALQGVLLPGYDMVSNPRNLRGGRSSNFAPDDKQASCGRSLTSSSFRTHGTEVASIVAGNGYAEMWGVNPKAKILPVRVFGACGMAPEDMADAIRWAAGLPVSGAPINPNPAKVINISISGGAAACRPSLQSAVDAATSRGIFIVVAAGNNFQRPLAEPANCQGVISVGALSAENQIEKYSALDPRTSVYTVGGGPALRIDKPWSDNKLRVATLSLGGLGGEKLVVEDKGIGTSFASPVVAGFLSLLLSHRPTMKPADWSTQFSQFVRHVPPLAKCPSCVPQGLVLHESISKVKP